MCTFGLFVNMALSFHAGLISIQAFYGMNKSHYEKSVSHYVNIIVTDHLNLLRFLVLKCSI